MRNANGCACGESYSYSKTTMNIGESYQLPKGGLLEFFWTRGDWRRGIPTRVNSSMEDAYCGDDHDSWKMKTKGGGGDVPPTQTFQCLWRTRMWTFGPFSGFRRQRSVAWRFSVLQRRFLMAME